MTVFNSTCGTTDAERQTDRQTDRQIDRQTDRQTHRQTDTQTVKPKIISTVCTEITSRSFKRLTSITPNPTNYTWRSEKRCRKFFACDTLRRAMDKKLNLLRVCMYWLAITHRNLRFILFSRHLIACYFHYLETIIYKCL